MTGAGRPGGGRDGGGGDPGLPDPRPFRRIQLATAALLVGAALLTLLSDERPAAVRWGALAGVAVLIAAVWLITRRRRAAPGAPPRESGD